MVKVSLTAWNELAKALEEELGLKMVEDKAERSVKVTFQVKPAGGYRRVDISFEVGRNPR